AVSEAAPGQYEINLKHVPDAVTAADHGVLLKRLIKGVASNVGFDATFMAKPFANLPGNGLHIHFSLLDEAGRNVFDDGGERGSDTLRHAIGGLAYAMKESMAVLAPAHYGIANRIDPGPPIVGNAYEKAAKTLPDTWNGALMLFDEAKVLPDYLGGEFCRLFSECRRGELRTFHSVVSNLEYEWYLRTV